MTIKVQTGTDYCFSITMAQMNRTLKLLGNHIHG